MIYQNLFYKLSGSGKKATGKSVIAEPSSEELRSAVSDILKEVDFNVVSFVSPKKAKYFFFIFVLLEFT